MTDPFTLLEVSPRFDLDEGLLHTHFLRLVSAAHPDHFTDPLDQADAAQRCARINDAYRTLSDPESRARALLALRGQATDSMAADNKNETLPPAMLMEVMEMREALDEAVAASDQAEVARLRDQAQDQKNWHLQTIGRLLEAEPVDAVAVRRELNALRYVQRMLEQMPGE